MQDWSGDFSGTIGESRDKLGEGVMLRVFDNLFRHNLALETSGCFPKIRLLAAELLPSSSGSHSLTILCF